MVFTVTNQAKGFKVSEVIQTLTNVQALLTAERVANTARWPSGIDDNRGSHHQNEYRE